MKNVHQNVGIATEIVSISVSVAKLVVLPVWGTVSISGLYLLLSPKSDDVGTSGSGSGQPKNCVVFVGITLTSLPVINL